MTTLSYPYTLTAGQPENVNQLNSNLNAISTVLNGSVDTTNIASSVLDYAGISSASTVRRGKSIIAASESRTNTAYGTLTTPDQVSNVVLPTDGLIVVAYQALFDESVVGAAKAAIFLNSNQLQATTQDNRSQVQETPKGNGTSAAGLVVLGSYSGGLTSAAQNFGGNDPAPTTGHVVGGAYSSSAGAYAPWGPCYIFAAAGTYTVSVQFKATSGSVTAKGRKLWVWTMGF